MSSPFFPLFVCTTRQFTLPSPCEEEGYGEAGRVAVSLDTESRENRLAFVFQNLPPDRVARSFVHTRRASFLV